MCKLFFTSKEVATRFGQSRKNIQKIFNASKIPTIHRDSVGNKTIIEKDNIILLEKVINTSISSIDSDIKLSKKQLNNLRFHFLFLLLHQYKNQDANQFILFNSVDESFNIIVTFDYSFDRFIVHDFLSDTEYKFGRHWNLTTKNSNDNQKHKNSAHQVQGFWKNQPYGPRDNPQYKRIWINSFRRGA